MNAHPQSFIDYLYKFNIEAAYYECHEILENYWMIDLDNQNQRKHYWATLIQIAVAVYHYQNNNIKGASGILNRVLENINIEKEHFEKLGINVKELLVIINQQLSNINAGIKYQKIEIPISKQLNILLQD